MEFYTKLISKLDFYREYYFDLLRIYLGIGLAIKGIYFISHVDFLVSTMGSAGLSFASFALAHTVGMTHLVGGIFMALGLLTRLVVFAQIPVLFGAVFFVHFREGLFTGAQTLEFTAFILFTLLILFAHGPGPFSLDAKLFANKTEHEES